MRVPPRRSRSWIPGVPPKGPQGRTGRGPGPLLLLLCFLGGTHTSSAEAQRLNIRNYTQADGLPQIQVYAVHQDLRGYIWVGTNAGLARYDGRHFHSITAGDGLSSNTVARIDQFQSGRMVAAVDPGICFLDGGSISCLGPLDGVVPGQPQDLFLDENGDTWLATEGGISRISRNGEEVTSFTLEHGLPDLRTLAIHRDREGTLWAGNYRGLLRFEGAGWKEVPVAGRMGMAVAALDETPDGRLLLGTGAGLFVMAEGRATRLPLGSEAGTIRRIALEPDGTIWAIADGGLYRYKNGRADRFTSEHGVSEYATWDLTVDREGNLWMGNNNGLAKLVPSPFRFFSQEQGLPHPFVRALLEEEGGRLWFGTRGGVAFMENGVIRGAAFSNRLPDPRVFSLAFAPEGGLLVGTADGLAHVSPEGDVRILGTSDGLPHTLVYSMVPDGRGHVWVGTARGIVRWNGGRLTPPPQEELRDLRALSLLMDEGGRLWVGLTSGGIRFLERDSVFALGAGEGLTNQAIWDLAQDASGAVWAGSNGEGVFRIDGEEIRRFTHADGLGDDFGWQVLSDRRGDVWVFSGAGLNRISDSSITYYGVADGLSDLEGSAAAALETRDGTIWFGTGTGVYSYDPARDLPPPLPSRLFLESITLAGNEVDSSMRVFPPKPGVITFTFSAPSYRNEAGIRFRYRLAGTNEGWSSLTSDPVISLAGLGKGNYSLEVEAVAALGQSTPATLDLPFSVRAAFHETLWFRGGMGLLVVLGLLQIPGIRARHHEAERRRLEALVEERTGEIRENNRRLEREIQERREAERARESLETQLRQAQKMEAVGRLAGGIAHDFNNLLTSVMGYSELLAAEADPNSELGKDLDEIRKSAQKGAALVSQLLAFSRQQIVEWQPVDVGAALRDTMGMMGRVIGEQIRLEMELPDSPLWVRGDPSQLSQIILNLAVNARDAMPQGGNLLIAAARRMVEEPESTPFSDTVEPGRYICIAVSDSGEGMDEDTLRKAFEPFFTTKEVGKGSGLGLASVYGIVHQHRGFIKVSTAPGQGALFEIFLPETDPAGPADSA